MSPATILARADSVDSTVSNLTTILTCAGIVLGVGVVAIVPVMLAWQRRHRHSEGLAAVAVLWGLLAAISVSAATLEQMKYSREHLMAIESGYYDPNDTSDAPPLPLPAWAALGVGYAALLAWPFVGRKRSAADEAREDGKS